MQIARHPTRWWNFWISEEEKKETEEILIGKSF